MTRTFAAPDYNLEALSDWALENAIKVCMSHGLYRRNLNALFEESYARAGEPNPTWNVAGRF